MNELITQKGTGRIYGVFLLFIRITLFIVLFLIYLNLFTSKFTRRNSADVELTNCLDFSQDGSYIAVAARRSISFWKVDGGRLLLDFPCDNSDNTYAVFSPDNQFIAFGNSFQSNIIRISDGSLFNRFEDGFSPNLYSDFTDDSSCFVSTNGNIFDVSKRKLFRVNREDDKTIYRAINSKEGTPLLLAVSTKNNRYNGRIMLRLINVVTGKTIREIGIEDVNNLSFYLLNDDYRRIFSGGNKIFIIGINSVYILDNDLSLLRTLEFSNKFEINRSIGDVVFGVSQNGRLFATNNQLANDLVADEITNEVKVYDSDSLEMISKIPSNVSMPLRSIAVNAKRGIAACGYQKSTIDGTVVVYRIKDGSTVVRIEPGIKDLAGSRK